MLTLYGVTRLGVQVVYCPGLNWRTVVFSDGSKVRSLSRCQHSGQGAWVDTRRATSVSTRGRIRTLHVLARGRNLSSFDYECPEVGIRVSSVPVTVSTLCSGRRTRVSNPESDRRTPGLNWMPTRKTPVESQNLKGNLT